MQSDKIYEEIIPFSFIKLILGMLASLSILFLVLFVYQALIGSIGTRLAPAWFYLLMFLWFSGITIFVTNFRKLVIKITPQSITVGYGIFKSTVLWENVDGCSLDKASTISYGGWGMRIGRVKGKWRRVYNVIGCPGIVLELKKGKFRELVFSTKNPEKLMKVVGQQIEAIE
jgi:hypothetical protein